MYTYLYMNWERKRPATFEVMCVMEQMERRVFLIAEKCLEQKTMEKMTGR